MADGGPSTSGGSGSSRREALLGLGSLVLLARASPAAAAGAKEVGSYLPAAGFDDFVKFTPTKAKTPALRAGTVDPLEPYSFALPPSSVEAKVSNTQSGNYCQPRCDEPWTEVVFASDREGRVELIVAPLQKLTPRKNIKVEDLGTPEQLLPRIGNYITGTYLDEDEVVASTSQLRDGLTYYVYEVNAPYGKVGPHTLTAATVKGDLAFLFIVSANDKQWSKNQGRLREIVDSFRA